MNQIGEQKQNEENQKQSNSSIDSAELMALNVRFLGQQLNDFLLINSEKTRRLLSKLSTLESGLYEIVNAYGATQASTGRSFGVPRGTISGITLNRK